MDGNVIELHAPRGKMTPAREAELWEGVVRFMEHNGRGKVEIGLDDARRIAAMARRHAS